MRAYPLYCALSQQGLLGPVKPVSRLASSELTASAFSRLWISMSAVLITVPTVMQNSLGILYQLPPFCSER